MIIAIMEGKTKDQYVYWMNNMNNNLTIRLASSSDLLSKLLIEE